MPKGRTFELPIAHTVVPLPCFFPSVSSVKTNLMPLDYVELLDAATRILADIKTFEEVAIKNAQI